MPLSTQPPPEDDEKEEKAKRRRRHEDDDDFDNTPDTQDKDAPKPAESGTPGSKSVLTKAKDALPVARVANPDKMRVEGEIDPDKSAQDQVYSSAIGPERDPEKAWQEYAVQAINGLYPRLRNGVDYAVGRTTLMGDVELLDHGEDVNIDWGKVEEAARKLADANPYTNYEPKPSLAAGPLSGRDSGEVPYSGRGNLRQGDTPSEVNPRSNVKEPTQPHGADKPVNQFTQPTPPPDPHADKVTRR
jgi:hypothetical protein